MNVHLCEDAALLREFMNGDAGETAYALGDLDPDLWTLSVYRGAFDGDKLRGFVLFFHGFEPPSLTMHGEVEAVTHVLAETELPVEVFCLAPQKFKYAVATHYDMSHIYTLLRMVVSPDTFSAEAVPSLDGSLTVKHLCADDADRLNDLYAQAADPGESISAFLPSQVEQGVFFGVERDGELVAAAGNVFTLPTLRGHGLGKVTTAAVTQQLFENGITRVVLNVKASNSPARRVYEQLGYRIHTEFIEGPARRN
jgi:GNAT superfamily N-acetyltransferase